jgi:hypothetical protein
MYCFGLLHSGYDLRLDESLPLHLALLEVL